MADQTFAGGIPNAPERAVDMGDGTFARQVAAKIPSADRNAISGVYRRSGTVASGAGVTDVVNVQIVDTPTNTQCKFLVNRTVRSVVSLIGLTVLSIPSSPGVTWVHACALEP